MVSYTRHAKWSFPLRSLKAPSLKMCINLEILKRDGSMLLGSIRFGLYLLKWLTKTYSLTATWDIPSLRQDSKLHAITPSHFLSHLRQKIVFHSRLWTNFIIKYISHHKVHTPNTNIHIPIPGSSTIYQRSQNNNQPPQHRNLHPPLILRAHRNPNGACVDNTE